MIVTENGAPSLDTTGNARVNLFFKSTQDLYKNPNFINWINESWKESPLDTMKIIFQGRDCRGGKGDRKTFIKAMKYLSFKQPLWVKTNMDIIPIFGRYKDWIEILNDNTQNQIILLICTKLKEDLANMYEGKPVSLLAKWIPSEKRKLNKNNIITNLITIELYGTNEKEPYKKIRKEYLTPLRHYINIVENYICSNKWSEINYSIIPSCAMNRLKHAFMRHTPERFSDWLKSVKEGKAKINAKQLYPHELVKQYINNNNYDEVIELQWQQIVENTAKLGTFENSIVLSDVSDSMQGLPMEVSIALGILISSLTTEPFKNTIISFNTNPTIHNIPDSNASLYDKVQSMKSIPWGGSTDLYKVFELILNRAIEYDCEPEDMPKRLYILSDMQFDAAVVKEINFNEDNVSTNQQTMFDSINELYAKTKYKRPDIIFWNLRSDTTNDFPVASLENGVATISGFSPNILKNILNDNDISPYSIMRTIIDDERYSIIKKPYFLNIFKE